MKKLCLTLALLWPLLLPAANPSFNSFNTDQFGTENNKVNVKANPKMTNINYFDGTASGVLRHSVWLTNIQSLPHLYPPGSRIVVVADSLLGKSAGYPDTAFTLFRAIYGTKYTYFTNVAYSGQAVQNALTNFAARAAGWAPVGGTNTYLWLWDSTVNMAGLSSPEPLGADSTLSNIVYCVSNIMQIAITNGYTGILLFGSHVNPDWFNDEVVGNYNAWCRTNTQWNWFIDVAQLTDISSFGDAWHLDLQTQNALLGEVMAATTRRYARNALDGTGGGVGGTTNIYNQYFPTNITYTTNVTIGATNLAVNTTNTYVQTNLSYDILYIGDIVLTNLPQVSIGGTGTNYYSPGKVLMGNGTNPIVEATLGSGLNYDGATITATATGTGAGTNMQSLNLAWVTNNYIGSNAVDPVGTNIVIDFRKGNNHVTFLTNNAKLIFTNAYGGLHGTVLFIQDAQTNVQHGIFNIVGSANCGLHTNISANPSIDTNSYAWTALEYQTFDTNLMFLTKATNWSPLDILVGDVVVAAGISSQPTNLSVITNVAANFYCTGTGADPLAYFWETNLGGGDWVYVGNTFGGNTTHFTLPAANVVYGISNLQVRCVVSNEYNVSISSTVYLTINLGLEIDSPGLLTNVVVWLKASTLEVTPGNKVQSWPDSAGNQLAFWQDNTTYQPILQNTNGPNSQQYVQFSYSSPATALTNQIGLSTPFTVFLVLRECNRDGNPHVLWVDEAWTDRIQFYWNGTANNMKANLNLDPTNGTANTWEIISLFFGGSGAPSEYRLNNVVVDTAVINDSSITNMVLGSRGDYTLGYGGALAEMIVYTNNTAISNSTTWSYLTNKFHLP